MDRIAVFLNEKSEISTLEQRAKIVVYEKVGANWLVVKEIVNEIDFNSGLTVLRKAVQQLATQLDSCKIIVGKTIAGIVYQTFDRLSFDIFEVEEFSTELLSSILIDIISEQENLSNESSVATATAPVETNVQGVYFLDLLELQKVHPQISSKMALQNFIENKPFIQLDVICNHLPPWLDKMVEEKKIDAKFERLKEGKVKVSIYKTCCIS